MKYLPKILLVDDETDYLYLNTARLRNKGFDVYSISDSEEVFTIVNSFRPDLIILDVMLGKHDGRDMCRQLKNEPGNKHIKILLNSALPEAGKHYRLFGAEEFILKPHTWEH